MENVELSLTIKVGCSEYWREWPPDKLFKHKHATHARTKRKSSSIAASPNIDIVAVLALGYIHPVLLDWGLVVVDSSVEHEFGEESHPQVNGCLVFSRDTTVMLVKLVEIVFSLCVSLCSDNQRHSFII